MELANEKRGSDDETSHGEVPERAPPVEQGLQIKGTPRRGGRVEPVGETPSERVVTRRPKPGDTQVHQKRGHRQRDKAW